MIDSQQTQSVELARNPGLDAQIPWGVAPRVLLLAMPWNRWDYPSIQVGLLKAHLSAHGVMVRGVYPYLDLAQQLGGETYNRIADKLPLLLAESFFTVGVHDSDSPPPAWIQDILDTDELEREQIDQILQAIRIFLDELYASLSWDDWDVVGFSCTFNQVFASLALAARIKRHHSKPRIVFGGSNLHGRLGQAFLDQFDCIDCVISGPGEAALLRYVREGPATTDLLIDGEQDPAIALNVPDYSEYFASLPSDWQPAASIVGLASRGCHYGRCVFCAQNLEPGCRVYPAEWVDACLEELLRRYGPRRVEFADTAFPVALLDTSVGEHFGRGSLGMFSEFTAGLSERQFDQLKRVGFDMIQVGIESFHTGVLRRMKKPADLLTNVQCLKFAYERGIDIGYNLILDFPSTTPADIDSMLDQLQWLFHLPPPTALVPFQLQYSAPILARKSEYGLSEIRPHHHYRWLDPRFESGQLVPFYLEFHNQHPLPQALLEKVHLTCLNWHEHYSRGQPLLDCQALDTRHLVIDQRRGYARHLELSELAVAILQAARRPRLERTLRQALGQDAGFDEILEELVRDGLIMRDAGKLLALTTRCPPRERPKLDELESYFAPDPVSDH